MFKKIVPFLIICFISLSGFANQIDIDADVFPQAFKLEQPGNSKEVLNNSAATCVSFQPDHEDIEFKLTVNYGCCKVCRKGKACGNSCISRDKNCYQPPGCACNG